MVWFAHLVVVSKSLLCDDGQGAEFDIPSEFSMILGTLPSIIATAEFVVPEGIDQ